MWFLISYLCTVSFPTNYFIKYIWLITDTILTVLRAKIVCVPGVVDLALVAKWPTSLMIGEHKIEGAQNQVSQETRSESTFLSALYCIFLEMLSSQSKIHFQSICTLRIHFMLALCSTLLPSFWNSGPFFSLIILGKCHDMHQQRPAPPSEARKRRTIHSSSREEGRYIQN